MLFNESFLNFVDKRPTMNSARNLGYSVFVIRHGEYSSMAKFKEDVITNELKEICMKSVRGKYVNDTMTELSKAFKAPGKKTKQKTIEKNKHYEVAILKNIEGIHVGMLIIQTGECKLQEFENTPVLRLICARSGEGALLIYYYVQAMCYAYHTLNREECRYGLLELADHYDNIRGLCAYDKFGFREDYSIIRKNCFGFPESLPMIVDLENVTYDELDQVIALGYRIPQVRAPEPLCNKKFTKGNIMKQKQKTELKNRYNLYQKLMKTNSSYHPSLLVDGKGDEHVQGVLKEIDEARSQSKRVLDEMTRPRRSTRNRTPVKEKYISEMASRSQKRREIQSDITKNRLKDVRNLRVTARRRPAINTLSKNEKTTQQTQRRQGRGRKNKKSRKKKAKRKKRKN